MAKKAAVSTNCPKCGGDDILVQYYDKNTKDTITDPEKRHDSLCNLLYVQFTRECLKRHCRTCQWYWFTAIGVNGVVLNKPYKEVR